MSKMCRVCKASNTIGKSNSCVKCKDFDKIASRVWSNQKRLARVNRKDFPTVGDLALHIKNLYIKQNGRCYYTNYEMTLPIKDAPYIGLGMMCSPDRERADGLYDKENIVLCLNKINTMKTDLSSAKEFYEVCKSVTNFFEKRFPSVQNLSEDELNNLIESARK